MRFIAGKDDLLKEVLLLQGIVEKRSTRPILANTLLESDGDGVAIYATDLEVGLSTSFRAAVESAGSITVPAKKLADIFRLLPEGQEVALEVIENNYIRITCSRIEYKLAGAPKADFPSVPKYDFEKGTEIPAHVLKTMIARTIYAVTIEETRYALNGAQLFFDGGLIRMVATDAHRLALTEFPFEGHGGEPVEMLVPRKTLAELRTLISDEMTTVIFGCGENHIFFRAGERVLDSRMLEGQFPSYDKVLPKDNDKSIVMNKSALEKAIERVSLLSHETSRAVRLRFSTGKLLISSSNPEMGEAKEEIEAQYEGEDLTTGFNAKYLSDFIGSLGPEVEEVVIELKDEASAGLLSPGGEAGGVYKYVVMPMRI